MRLKLFECLIEHILDHVHHRSFRQAVRNNFVVEEIYYWRQIQLSPIDCKFSNVGNPLLVWPCSLEIPLENIGGGLPYLSSVGAVSFDLNRCLKREGSHQALNGFMVNPFPVSMERQRYPTVSVTTFILVINLTNTLFNIRILIRLAESL
ncbi:Uncharacterised protein [Klebsiella pneumoniae]|nr:Uncharacterised protein [Klebsiella pneumoniae]